SSRPTPSPFISSLTTIAGETSHQTACFPLLSLFSSSTSSPHLPLLPHPNTTGATPNANNADILPPSAASSSSPLLLPLSHPLPPLFPAAFCQRTAAPSPFLSLT
ncbi:hypothetical protein HAX54_000133, partial [Datura stramonium]|nr:hypothetical protein [Datura stramonium]